LVPQEAGGESCPENRKCATMLKEKDAPCFQNAK